MNNTKTGHKEKQYTITKSDLAHLSQFLRTRNIFMYLTNNIKKHLDFVKEYTHTHKYIIFYSQNN
jgi:hypothetical protein